VWLKNEYGNPPLIVTENGYGDAGQPNDADRIDYIRVRVVFLFVGNRLPAATGSEIMHAAFACPQGYLNALLRAVHEHGCNVVGYTVWSILDNFEWLDGYG